MVVSGLGVLNAALWCVGRRCWRDEPPVPSNVGEIDPRRIAPTLESRPFPCIGSLILVGRYAGCDICIEDAPEGRWIQIRRITPGNPIFDALVILDPHEGAAPYDVKFEAGLVFDEEEIRRLVRHWDTWGFVEDGVLIDRYGTEQAATRSRLSK